MYCQVTRIAFATHALDLFHTHTRMGILRILGTAVQFRLASFVLRQYRRGTLRSQIQPRIQQHAVPTQTVRVGAKEIAHAQKVI